MARGRGPDEARRADDLVRRVRDVAGLKILDVGCGAGRYAAELLADGADVMGIDGSATLLGRMPLETFPPSGAVLPRGRAPAALTVGGCDGERRSSEGRP